MCFVSFVFFTHRTQSTCDSNQKRKFGGRETILQEAGHISRINTRAACLDTLFRNEFMDLKPTELITGVRLIISFFLPKQFYPSHVYIGLGSSLRNLSCQDAAFF